MAPTGMVVPGTQPRCPMNEARSGLPRRRYSGANSLMTAATSSGQAKTGGMKMTMTESMLGSAASSVSAPRYSAAPTSVISTGLPSEARTGSRAFRSFGGF